MAKIARTENQGQDEEWQWLSDTGCRPKQRPHSLSHETKNLRTMRAGKILVGQIALWRLWLFRGSQSCFSFPGLSVGEVATGGRQRIMHRKMPLKITYLVIGLLFTLQQSPVFWASLLATDSGACSSCVEGKACCFEHRSKTMQCKNADNKGCFFASREQQEPAPSPVVHLHKPFLPVILVQDRAHPERPRSFLHVLKSYADVILPCQDKPPRVQVFI